MDALHRMVTGQSVTRNELIFGGVFVFIWFGMDVIQFTDWAMTKYAAPPQSFERAPATSACR